MKVVLAIIITTLVAVLFMNSAVPFFSQKDAHWKSIPLDCPPCETVGECGCALASLSMVFTYYGVDYNPKEMLECMDIYACPIGFREAVNWCGKGELLYIGSISYSNAILRITSKPVILKLVSRRDPNQTHFVVATSSRTAHDPGKINGRDIPLEEIAKDWRIVSIIIIRGKG